LLPKKNQSVSRLPVKLVAVRRPAARWRCPARQLFKVSTLLRKSVDGPGFGPNSIENLDKRGVKKHASESNV
jgi:hypothetical protein